MLRLQGEAEEGGEETMNEENQCCEAEAISSPRKAERFWIGLRRWVFLNIWCRYLYRPTMRLLHCFNLHYAPPQGLMHGEKPDGHNHHWCQWCGLRGTTVDSKYFDDLLKP